MASPTQSIRLNLCCIAWFFWPPIIVRWVSCRHNLVVFKRKSLSIQRSWVPSEDYSSRGWQYKGSGINPGIQDPLGVAHRKSSYFREGRYSTCLEKRKKKTAARPCTATTRCGWRLKFMGKPTWNEWKLDKMMDMKWYVWCNIVWFTVNIVPCISCTTRLYDVDIFGVSFLNVPLLLLIFYQRFSGWRQSWFGPPKRVGYVDTTRDIPLILAGYTSD